LQNENRYREYLKAELEAAAMYRALAGVERDADRAAAFTWLMEGELRHASRWAEKLGLDPGSVRPASAGIRVMAYQIAARALGTTRLIPRLLRGEAEEIDRYSADPEATDLAPEERHHAEILRGLGADRGGRAHPQLERAQRFALSGSLRAAILGVNDGLVSNFSLVMGVAGGTNNADFVLLAGVAGLLAGAFSMAAGEYVSVRSQRDVYEHRIRIEAAELEEWPGEERDKLVLIYQAKGLTTDEAKGVADRIMAQPDLALDTMVREELGLVPDSLGSPSGAAISSFLAFVTGAVVPVLPYFFGFGSLALVLSAAFSALALVIVGGAVAASSGRSKAWGSARMFLAGGLAAAVTYGVGRAIGHAITG
jgi:VIT1/CCC1 family predicted Fe2+/Mn2+ transporter